MERGPTASRSGAGAVAYPTALWTSAGLAGYGRTSGPHSQELLLGRLLPAVDRADRAGGPGWWRLGNLAFAGECNGRSWGLVSELGGCGWACWANTVECWASACGASLGGCGPPLTLPREEERRRL
ncbi:hypothetical protein NDU88_003387 [Pleurodeles waltl]|uniref:Uncharacterized protein n=1 Tax=Pleurodeles waltl TaxID=8319 RepID=A0AAV7UDJ9_PLEWA|nr:hypothetical protein NDU88_003387 [Pleurodeles waltl]